jgi:hypothetical protein
LVPESEIVLRELSVAQHVEPLQPQPGLFAGLKLDAGSLEADVPTPSEQDRERHELARSVRTYVRVWMDVDRMRQAGLPVLPHQTAALAQADRAFDQSLAGFGQDLDAALTRASGLAQGVDTDTGLVALIEAGRVARAEREALEQRAREAIRTWARLEAAYAEAEQSYGYLAVREITARMEQFAHALKQDVKLEKLLRQRGTALGIAPDSSLARVVQSEDLEQAVVQIAGFPILPVLAG